MLNYRSSSPLIKFIRKQVSGFINQKENNLQVEITKFLYNLLIIPAQKKKVKEILVAEKNYLKFKRKSEYCVILSTKNRLEYTKKCLKALEKTIKADFDLIWIDGSSDSESISYFKKYNSKKVSVVQKIAGIGGGPDVAILLGLNIGYKSGYKNVTLLENDIVLSSKWQNWIRAAKKNKKHIDGLEIKGFSSINYESRVLQNIKRNKVSVLFHAGAFMLSLERIVIPIILDSYRLVSAKEVSDYLLKKFKIRNLEKNYDLFGDKKNFLKGADWSFGLNLLQKGYCIIAPIPTMGYDCDRGPEQFKTRYTEI